MNIKQTEGAIEAILFTMGESVEAEKIAAAIDHDVDTTIRMIHNMMDSYEAEGRGIKIIELDGSFQLCTKQEYYDTLIKVCSQPKKYTLSDAALETLSIIAYKQPITKMEIEKIRGVNSDRAVNKLVELELVKEVGRLDAPGRPMLFGTTEELLRTFGAVSYTHLEKEAAMAAQMIADNMDYSEDDIYIERYKKELEAIQPVSDTTRAYLLVNIVEDNDKESLKILSESYLEMCIRDRAIYLTKIRCVLKSFFFTEVR